MTSVAELYARATTARSLVLTPEYQTDADVLLAAGLSAQARPDLALGLDVYRLMHSRGRAAGELHTVAAAMEGMLLQQIERRNSLKVMRERARQALVLDTLHWWLDPACSYCGGHGSTPSDTAPTLTGDICQACKGTGRRPLHRVVPGAHEKLAQHLVDQLDRLMLLVQAEMAKRLRDSMGGI